MTSPPSRHRYVRLVALTDRLIGQLELLDKFDGPARRRPLTRAQRGAGRRLLAEAALLVPLPEQINRAPAWPGRLMASTLQTLLIAKDLITWENSAPHEKGLGTYARRRPPE